MPVDLDRYRQGPRKGSKCSIGQLYERLDTDLADDLRTLLGDAVSGDVQYARIEEFSEEDFGTKIGATSASRHARGLCKCEQ